MKHSSPETTLPPRPRARQTFSQLRELQRLALGTIRHPLSPSWTTQSRWNDGRPMRKVAAEFIKPNDRLTSIERLQIYNQQYWYRLLDCLQDDYPGLRAILGESKFHRLSVDYLNRYPSKSFTLRNLGSRLQKFLSEERAYGGPRRRLLLDMSQFEWTQVVAFDGEARPALVPDDLLGQDPRKLRLDLQPYLGLLELRYPLDDFVIAVKKQQGALRSETSNAVETTQRRTSAKKVRLPRPQAIRLAVHRFDNALYYKRLEPAAYNVLLALQAGKSLQSACNLAIKAKIGPDQIGKWFETWMKLGWFCRKS